MKASEARKLTDHSLKGPAIEKFTAHIDARIINAAKEGKSTIHNPQVGRPNEGASFFLSSNVEKAIKLYYENNGFAWVDHPDSDLGHPSGGAYTTLRW